MTHPIIKKIIATRFIHYLLAGSSGTLLGILTTGIFAEFILGRERYFAAFLIGYVVTLLYNFALNYTVVFNYRGKDYFRRFIGYTIYSLTHLVVQSILIKLLVPIIGLEYYIFTITAIMLFTAILGFVFLKIVLFKNKNVPLNKRANKK